MKNTTVATSMALEAMKYQKTMPCRKESDLKVSCDLNCVQFTQKCPDFV